MIPEGEGGPLTLLVCAVEPSADELGAELMASLHRARGDIRFVGCGGPAMIAAGLKSEFSIDTFSVIGPLNVAKVAPAAFGAASRLGKLASTENVDAAILIDAWAFSELAAKRIRKSNPSAKLFKYVAPQVWASRPNRAEKLEALFDGLVTLFNFETPYFEDRKLDLCWAGHSGFQKSAAEQGDPEVFRERYGIGDQRIVCGLLGSRASEVQALGDVYGRTLGLIHKKMPDLHFCLAPPDHLLDATMAAAQAWPVPVTFIPPTEKNDLFTAADVALAASGTVTTQLALHGTPMVVAYKIDPVSAFWARRVLTIEHVSMINIAGGRMIIPEFIQENCRAEPMADALMVLLSDAGARARQRDAFIEIAREHLGIGGPPAGDIAARAVLSWIAK